MSGSLDTPKQTISRPLHFVNTDCAMIATKDATTRTRDVKSHLSGHYRRWKKQQALSGQTGRSRKGKDTRGRSSLPLEPGEPNNANKPLLAVKPEYDSESSYDDDKESPEETIPQTSRWSSAESTTLQNALSHGNSDPFSALPLPVDPKTNMYIQLFHEGTTVMCWTTVVDDRLKGLLQHEALMHGVLAISKVIAATYLLSRQNPVVLLPESRQHYGELLRLMRRYFEDRAEIDPDLAIEMIHAAMMFSFLAREYDDFELHLKSLKAIIDSLGGVRAVDQRHGSRFLNAERLRGLFLLKKPLVPVDVWSPGSWSKEAKFRPYDELYKQGLSLMSSATQPPLPESPFCKQVQSLILDYRDMLAAGSVAATLFRTKQQPGVDMITQWLGFRSHALTIRTAEIVSEMTSLKQSDASLELSLYACTCLATNFVSHLIHFSANPTVGLSYVPFPILTQNLKEVDGHIRRGARLQHQDLYLWTLFVGACAELASRTWSCDPSFRGSSWCSVHLAHTIERLGIHTIHAFKAKLRQFLFPYILESYLTVLFDKRHELISSSVECLHLQD